MFTKSLRLFSLSVLFLCVLAETASLHAARTIISPSDTFAVWVYFTDKQPSATPALSKRAILRRQNAGFSDRNSDDYPVSAGYIKAVEQTGATLRHTFAWENAASFNLPAAALHKVEALPFVEKISPVREVIRGSVPEEPQFLSKRMASDSLYGGSFEQLSALHIPQAFEYLSYRFPESQPGEGVRIAFFDSGFRLHHRCFSHLSDRNAVIATRDFVDNDDRVDDPDSVVANPDHPYFLNDEHGSEVFSLVAGYDPPYFQGSAWGAEFLLARTENTYYDSTLDEYLEFHTEEDNWAAAAVWADSLGVDIISSSVGYNTDFQDTIVVERSDGTFDTLQDYAKSDMDGFTTLISRAAQGAIDRGIIVVNAVGNEGSRNFDGDTSLIAPADVKDVIAVSASTIDGQLSMITSSKGPTAGGVDKPDLSAPGAWVYIPDIYSYSRSAYNFSGRGTSYAAPFISGICALMLQSAPDISPDSLRKKLYRFCKNPRGVDYDYRLGRGIPDAYKCSAGENDVFIEAVDTGATALRNAIISLPSGDSLSRTDQSGHALVTVPAEHADSITLTRGVLQRTEAVGLLPGYVHFEPCSLEVSVLDSSLHIIHDYTLNAQTPDGTITLSGDSLGKTLITHFFHVPLAITITKTGFSVSDTLDITLSDGFQQRTILLKVKTDTTIEVFPTIVRRARNETMSIRITVPASTTDGTLNASIRSVNGDLIWSKQAAIPAMETTIDWNGMNRNHSAVAPGTYFVFVSFGDKRVRKKIIIL